MLDVVGCLVAKLGFSHLAFGVFWSLRFGVWSFVNFWSVSCKLQWFCCCLLVLSLFNLVQLPRVDVARQVFDEMLKWNVVA